jgi:hypothetical protein
LLSPVRLFLTRRCFWRMNRPKSRFTHRRRGPSFVGRSSRRVRHHDRACDP